MIQNSTARAHGKLLQHLTGVQVFLDHEYEVGPEVLVPRPETEVLVRAAMDQLKEPQFGLELGIGSGVISIELLSHFESLTILASELSAEARDLALRNRNRILASPSSSRSDWHRMLLKPFRSLIEKRVWQRLTLSFQIHPI